MARRQVLPLPIVLFLGLTVAGQEATKLPPLHAPTTHLELQPLHGLPVPPAIAVPVDVAHLHAVSSSVLLSESWLRHRVLSVFPSTNISAVVVGRGVRCSSAHEPHWSLILPSVKNLYHSLLRWGLEKEIKVSAAFSPECLSRHEQLKPLLSFLRAHNSFYLLDPPPNFSVDPVDAGYQFSAAHEVALESQGFSLWVIKGEKRHGRSRRLSSSVAGPETKPFSSPSRSPVGKNPAPWFASAPDGTFSFVPVSSPSELPDAAPSTFPAPSPPCAAAPAAVPFPPEAPAPRGSGVVPGAAGLWCVAKPTAPAEVLQEAMDYACGVGGANCEEIRPQGSCFFPDNVVAHASFAFNSYWQKTKRSGGSCSFEGTAVLINSDPSFLQCRYEIS